jgi:hypothetical protein
MTPIRATLLAVTLAWATTALAGPPPNFAGTWVLNAKRGQNLGMMAALQETLTVTQTADRLTVASKATFGGQDTLRTVIYDLTGKPVQNEDAMGARAETVARWVDGKLVVTWTTEGAVAGSKNLRTETRSLAADGASLNVESVRGTNPPLVMVYEKKK